MDATIESILWDLKTGKGKTVIEKPDLAWVRNHARSSDGRQLALIKSDRVRLVDLEALLDPVELNTRLWATRFDPYWHIPDWHTDQLEAHGETGAWFAALYHVNQLLQRQPADAKLLQERRDILAEAVKRDPKDAAALAAQARLLLEQGHLGDYRKACRALFELAGDFKDETLMRRLVATCILAPDALADFAKLLNAFKKTMSEKYPEDLRLYGGLLLRAGKAEDALTYLERARNDEPEAPYEDLLLTLAYQQQKKLDEAKSCLDRAVVVLDQRPAEAAVFDLQAGFLSPLHAVIASQASMLPDPRAHVVGWQGWIELQVLRREAIRTLPE